MHEDQARGPRDHQIVLHEEMDTLLEGCVGFWCRGRDKAWRRGEYSGHGDVGAGGAGQRDEDGGHVSDAGGDGGHIIGGEDPGGVDVGVFGVDGGFCDGRGGARAGEEDDGHGDHQG